MFEKPYNKYAKPLSNPVSRSFRDSQMCQSNVYATSWHLNAEVTVVAGGITKWQC